MIWNISGYDVLIDDEDYERLKEFKYNVYRHKVIEQGLYYFYRNIYINGKKTTTKLHRDIMRCTVGDGLEVDHRYGDTLDNRKENLRFSTHAENMRNQKTPKNNTSGVKGVGWYKRTKKWRARIWINGRQHTLSYHSDIEDARKAYAKASVEYHGEFSRLS